MSFLIFSDQRSWMRYFGQPAGPDTVQLYRTLVQEETAELQTALERWDATPSVDALAEVADGAIDTLYVVIGLLHAFGLNPQALWDEVHRSNIAKIRHACTDCGATGIIQLDGDEAPCPTCKGQGHVYEVRRREDGKVLKPDGWEPPHLRPLVVEAAVLAARGE